MTRWPATLVLAWSLCSASAQPVVLETPGVEASIREAYRGTPIAERVELTHRSATGVERTGVVDVWIDATSGDGALALRMGGLWIWAGEGEIRVADAPEGGRVWTTTLDGAPTIERLSRRVPSTPLPQISSAFGSLTPGETPATPELRWEIARRGSRIVHLVGRSGEVVVTGRVAEGRWRHWTALHADDGWSLTASVRSLAADLGANAWRVEIEGRTPVERLADLRPAPEPDALAVLDPMPLAAMSGRPIDWGSHLRSLGTSELGVFVLYRADPEEDAAQRRASALVARLPRADVAVRVWGVAAYPLSAFDRFALTGESARWDRKLVQGDRLLWSAGLDGTLARFDADATVYVVGVDRIGRVWVSLAADDDAAVAEAIEQIDVAARALVRQRDE